MSGEPRLITIYTLTHICISKLSSTPLVSIFYYCWVIASMRSKAMHAVVMSVCLSHFPSYILLKTAWFFFWADPSAQMKIYCFTCLPTMHICVYLHASTFFILLFFCFARLHALTITTTTFCTDELNFGVFVECKVTQRSLMLCYPSSSCYSAAFSGAIRLDQIDLAKKKKDRTNKNKNYVLSLFRFYSVLYFIYLPPVLYCI